MRAEPQGKGRGRRPCSSMCLRVALLCRVGGGQWRMLSLFLDSYSSRARRDINGGSTGG